MRSSALHLPGKRRTACLGRDGHHPLAHVGHGADDILPICARDEMVSNDGHKMGTPVGDISVPYTGGISVC